VILATPFDVEGAVDHASLSREVEHALAAGADGVVALGVFGEATSLSLAEQQQVAATAARTASGTRLVLGVSGRSTEVVVEQGLAALESAAGTGAERDDVALMVQVNSAAEDTLVAHLDEVHRRTGAGIVLQDYPATSGVSIPVGTLVRVVVRCPYVVAVKAEAPPTPPAIAEVVAGTGVPVFGGLGGVGLVDELAAGAAGAMTGFSAPEGLRAAIDAHRDGGFTAAREAWAPWLPLANFEGQAGIALSLRKTLMHRRGVIDHPGVRPPAQPMPDSLAPLLEQHLATLPSTSAAISATHPGGH
jgi:4-hydroxy-tetrahydrodipicolinate synthase